MFELVKFLILAVSSLECFSEIRIFLFRLWNRYPLRYSPDFFRCWRTIFFCFPWVTFGVPEPSRRVQKTAKTEKKWNDCWLLYRKFSGTHELFCSWRFKKNSFFKMFSIKLSFRISNYSLSTIEALHPKTSPN